MKPRRSKRIGTKSQAVSVTNKFADELATHFIEGLKNGTAPWIKPWDDSKVAQALEMPYNPTTGKAYSGSNALRLMMVSPEIVESGDARWMTYKQAKAVGAQVRKGERGTRLLKWVEMTKQEGDAPKGSEDKPKVQDKDKDGEQKRMVGRPFNVFHASQIDGLPEAPKREFKPMSERIKGALDLVEQSKAVVRHGGNRAAYSPALDMIMMPSPEQFHSEAGYAATLLHELGHWTGHRDRLNRTFGRDFGSPDYAREELRAEMASFAISQRMGLPHDPGNHVSYIGSWIRVLENDPRELMRAASDVDKILKHLKVPEIERERLPQAEREQEQTKTASNERIAKASAEHGPMTKKALESRANARKQARAAEAKPVEPTRQRERGMDMTM
ncbi:MAG: ArdC family protein [Lysobacteraceae bacterium]